MKLCVITTILVSCLAFYNASTIRPTATIATISNKNPCDVYLIVNFLLILHKHGILDHNLSTSERTPLGLLSSQIEIQKVNDLSFVWNPRTAKVIFIIQTNQLNSLFSDIQMTFTMNSVDWECLLNELIGVNNIGMSQKTIQIFKYLSQMFATALGVKTPPYALLNLYGLIIIPTSLSGNDCGTTTFEPITDLVDISDNKLLATEIARCSLIIDAATYCNAKFQFSNCACLLHTCSGYATSPLVGDLRLADSLESAISGLLNIYTSEDIRNILIQVLMEHVAYCDIGQPLSYIFDDQNLVGYAADEELQGNEQNFLLGENEETVEDPAKCSKAPEIGEFSVTTVSVIDETQTSTQDIETTTEEETTKKPRIFIDATNATESTTSASTTSKVEDETTLTATTTESTTAAPSTTSAATTTATEAPTTTSTTTEIPTTTQSEVTVATAKAEEEASSTSAPTEA